VRHSAVIVGPFPPPSHGNAIINKGVAEQIGAFGVPVAQINTASPVLERNTWSRVARLGSIAKAFRKFAMSLPDAAIVYLSVSGGFAILYECVFVVLARMLGKPIVLHHHTYNYLTKYFPPAWLLMRLAGNNALHICLSGKMKCRLVRDYEVVRALVLSNAAFMPRWSLSLPRAKKVQNGTVIGLISNLCPEKGLDDFLAVADQSQKRGLAWRFRLAGPFQTRRLESHYKQLLRDAGNVEYLGPLYGVGKREFFQGLDVFLFPTRYLSEAEPIVILEALNSGVPCIASDRGCISEILEGVGETVSPSSDFVGEAVSRIAEWTREPSNCDRLAELSRTRFVEMQDYAREIAGQLFQSLAQGRLPVTTGS